jgi:hypothetical protein
MLKAEFSRFKNGLMVVRPPRKRLPHRPLPEIKV